jgi:hypothetical protein
MRVSLGWVIGWGRASNRTAIENARVATTACTRARLERVEVELHVAELAALRDRPAITA